MVMPCAGCIACCISGEAAGGGGVGVLVLAWTFSDIVFLLHLRRARSRPRLWGTLPGSGGVCSGDSCPWNERGAADQQDRAPEATLTQCGRRSLAREPGEWSTLRSCV